MRYGAGARYSTQPPCWRAGPCSATTALAWSSDARVSSTGAGAVGEQLADDAHALLGRLARAVDGLGHALAQRAVVVDERVADVGERQPRSGATASSALTRPAARSSSSARSAGSSTRAMLPDDRAGSARATGRSGR